ncbi:MAG: dTDP-4-dehydrorhamnose reductase [Deltaproteobacteria bacterium]|nr:dTDP-4-dehydrorhamnose reductase [Deltaproteobacteria bacterium]
MNAIIFGANGTLGTALANELPRHGVDVRASLKRADVNIADESSVRHAIAEFKPDVVFNAAAYTNVDGAEDDADACYIANAIGPENVARACRDSNAIIVHYSTDFVFDGEQERAYDEFDPVSPQGVYGRSKVAGERMALAACERTFVLRVGCLYGQGGRNFPSTILDRLKAGQALKADATRKGSPTWVVPVARLSAALCKTQYHGLYHCTANGETSWADYAFFLAGKLGVSDEKVAALPYGALALKAARPRRAILDNRMLRLRGLDSMGTWQEQAEGFIASQAARPTP